MGGGVGIPGEKARRGGLEGWPVRRRTGGGEWFWAGEAARAGCGAGGSAGGGWRLRAVEVEDNLQALDFVSNGWKID